MSGLIEGWIDWDQVYHDIRGWRLIGQSAGEGIYYIIENSESRREDTVICSPN